MGVITKISLEDVQLHFECQTISSSTNGVSDSVYFLDDEYILKIFESKDSLAVNEEIKLLSICDGLKVPKLIKKGFFIHDKPALIYKKCDGKSLEKATKNNLEEIGKFLQTFHQKTAQKKSQNSDIFAKDALSRLIEIANHKPFFELFSTIDIVFQNDGIIHGDLFLDNATFLNDKLSCVFDFSEACNGDFYFDLAVVALSWCENNENIGTLLESYGATIEVKDFIHYIRYAGLYYSVTRFLANRNFGELLEKIHRL